MKILLYSRPQTFYQAHELLMLVNALKDNGLEYQVYKDFATQINQSTGIIFRESELFSDTTQICDDAQVMVSYGGDGTFLGAVQILNNRPIPIIGVNSGRLGFLANVTKNAMNEAFKAISDGCYTIEERSLLHVEGEFDTRPHYPYAFNEMTIQRQSANTISTSVYVNGEMIASYWGDGVLVSTPSGSTAYSLSVGGPVVSPDCHCFVISPIAPHNLTMRPVVIPDTNQITLKVSSRDKSALVTLDNNNYIAPDGATFNVSKAPNSVFLVHLQNISFYDTLRNKMMWGKDSRDENANL